MAEAAVTVLDDAQGKGLGTLLLRTLADAARERGITTFRGECWLDLPRLLDAVNPGPKADRSRRARLEIFSGVLGARVILALSSQPSPRALLCLPCAGG